MIKNKLLTACIIVLGVTNLHAQTTEKVLIKTGKHIRVTAPHAGGRHIIGKIQSLDADSLIIQVEKREEITPTYILWLSDRIALSRSDVELLEVKKKRILPGKSALIGMGVGLVSGVLLASVTEQNSGGDAIGSYNSQHIPLLTFLGGAIGGIIDLRKGSWHPVPLKQVQLSIDTSQGSDAGLSLSLRF